MRLKRIVADCFLKLKPARNILIKLATFNTWHPLPRNRNVGQQLWLVRQLTMLLLSLLHNKVARRAGWRAA